MVPSDPHYSKQQQGCGFQWRIFARVRMPRWLLSVTLWLACFRLRCRHGGIPPDGRA